MGFIKTANQSVTTLRSSTMTSCVSSSGESGQQATLILLDQQRLPVDLTSDLMTSQLLQMAADRCQLTDTRHFGIACRTESGENHWLHADMRVMEHELITNGAETSTPLQLYFLVRYYPESFRHLIDPAAVELLYQQVKSLVFKGELDAGEEVFHLAALSLQAAHGDYTDDSAVLQLLKRTAVLPSTVLNFCSTMQQCEERVCEEYRSIVGTSRGSAIVSYLSVVEKLPAYGVHFYTVTDKSRCHCLLGISSRGIAQYPLTDKAAPKRLFAWKNLENVTFRDKRFSIEVDEPKKVVHALSSFNVYEEAISSGSPVAGDTSAALATSVVSTASSVDHQLISAISEPNTQVSVSRRTLGPGHISVYSWFAQCQSACRSVWLTAVSLHQFHVESNRELRAGNLHERDLADLTRDLCQRRVATQSLPLPLLSPTCAHPLSRSGSSRSLPPSLVTTELLVPSCSSSGVVATPLAVTALSAHELRAVQTEMAAALLTRRQTLEAQLSERIQQLRLLCLREAELTGLLPSETPLQPGEQPPAIRRRMGTSFQLPETLLNRLHTSKEIVAALELDLEIQRKITTAALKLANDASLQKTIRKQRRLSYQMSAQKLRDIEGRLKVARNKQKQLSGQQGDPRPSSDGEDHHTEDEDSAGSSDGCTRYYTASSSSSSSSRLPPQHTGLLRTAASASSESASHSAPASPKLPPRSQSSAVLQQQRRQPPLPPQHSTCNKFIGQPSVGYVPSSVYTRSSYRIKQYPTLSNQAPVPVPGDVRPPVLADAPILPPPPQYWSVEPSPSRVRQPVHHLSVDELDCASSQVAPLQVDGTTSVDRAPRGAYISSSSVGGRLLQYADSPLSGASEAEVGRRGWQETSLDCVEVAARRRRRRTPQAVVATPAHVIPLESAATPRQRHPPPAPPLPSLAAQSPVNETLIEPGSYQPYRETSKPFEMADFYKYSERYRRSQSTLSATAIAPSSSSVHSSPPSSGPKDQWAPEGGCSPVGSSSGCSSGADSSASEQMFGTGCSLAEAIQSEMMGWYDAGRVAATGDTTERSRPATLV